MDALSPAERQRRSELLALIRTRITGRSETEDGLCFRLRADPELPTLAGEFLSLERRCCPFIRFGLEIEAEGGPALLRLGGRPGVKEFLRAALLQEGAPL